MVSAPFASLLWTLKQPLQSPCLQPLLLAISKLLPGLICQLPDWKSLRSPGWTSDKSALPECRVQSSFWPPSNSTARPLPFHPFSPPAPCTVAVQPHRFSSFHGIEHLSIYALKYWFCGMLIGVRQLNMLGNVDTVCYGLNCVPPPKFIYWSYNPEYLRMWPYVEMESSQR